MNHAEIYRIALASGFKLKQQPDRTMDLNPYVYRFAEALLEQDGNQWKAAHDDLAEQVERLGEVLERSMNGLEWYRESHPGSWSEADDEHLEECRKALEKAPTTSLARLKAQWQAEAIRETANDLGHELTPAQVRMLRDRADRWQAEEGSRLRQHCKQTAEEVSSWAEWKRNCLTTPHKNGGGAPSC